MKRKYNYFLLLWLHFFAFDAFGQEVTFYEQLNGQYDFTIIGNTLNTAENNSDPTFSYLTESSAALNLNPGDTVLKAYLYWAGSGTGDFDITLNGTAISAERTFNHFRYIYGLPFDFFAASADITEFIQQNGNTDYTFAGIEISAALLQHFPFRTNFSGWAIVIIYENENLPINQINIYDGLEGLPTQVNFVLDNLYVTSTTGSKIGFLAWEGDTQHSVNENVVVNGHVVTDSLNPFNNIFNSTNSFTGSTELYNMDIDVFNAENYINIGDTSADVQITSGGDFVLMNVVLTKFTSKAIDATISIDDVISDCGSRLLTVDYTVYNSNATWPLPANTPIAIYANHILIGNAFTLGNIENNESESNTISLVVPASIGNDFELTFVVDDHWNGTGIVDEINEDNNSFSTDIIFTTSTLNADAKKFETCHTGFGRGRFNLELLLEELAASYTGEASIHESITDAETNSNPLSLLTNYESEAPKTIYIRFSDNFCNVTIVPVLLEIKNCPPTVYNFISANEDGFNDSFFIDGLRNIFVHFEIEIYNRWGYLIWTGNQHTGDWRGEVTKNLKWNGNISADGTYFYLLHLNDPDYPDPLQGFLYITR